MADVRTLKLNLLADVSQFGQGISKADLDTKSLSTNIKKYGKVMAKAFAVAAAAAAAFAVKIGVDAIKSASDFNEEVSKTSVIFGDGADEINKFAKTASAALGLSRTEALKASGTFAILGKGAGLTGTDLTKFSKSATTLAADLGSFFNTKAEDAITAIGAALRGESEPIRKYGVLLNDSTLKAKAMEMGLYDGKGALDIQAKSLAAYQVILDQTKDAQGDFARTSDGLANQQKILSTSLENLKITMGQSLLPMMLRVVEQATIMAKAFGGDDPQGLSERARELAGVYDGQGSGAYNLGLALRNVGDAFGNMFSAINGEGPEANSTLQNFAEAVNNVATAINALGDGYQKALPVLRFIQNPFNLNIPEAGFTPRPKGRPKGLATGGSVSGGGAYRVGEFGPEMFVPSGSGSIRKDTGGGGGNTFILNGIIDAESARRSIERILQQSSRRTGAINLVGGTL